MSAKHLPEELWDIQFAFPGKTRRHWRSVLTTIGTRREAEIQAQQLFNEPDYAAAVDLLIALAEPAEPQPETLTR